jgi:hypothetical protein
VARRRSSSALPWAAAYYVDENGQTPAREALFDIGLPKPVRLALLARVTAVVNGPPTSFPTGTPIWSLMTRDRERGRIDMSGIFEVRDKHGPTLYRLFCVIDSEAGQHGMDARLLVMLSLATKPVRTAMPQAVYRAVRAQADRYFSMTPRPIAQEI